MKYEPGMAPHGAVQSTKTRQVLLYLQSCLPSRCCHDGWQVVPKLSVAKGIYEIVI